MLINKYNSSIVGTGDLCIHDLLIHSIDFNIETKSLNIRISDYQSERLVLRFENIFELWFSSIQIVIGPNNNEVLSWEEIPNEHNSDAFIEETKNKCLANGGEWNDDLFAVSFLLADFSELRIICERIITTASGI